MPHAPITISTVVLGNLHTHTVHTSGYDPGWRTLVNQEIPYMYYRAEPASTNNPVRPDGTRAPSAYYIRRVLARLPPAMIKQARGSGWGYYMKESTSAGYYNSIMTSNPLSVLGRLVASDLEVSLLDARARTKFLNKLADASGKDQVQLGVMAGEVRETIHMASHLATELVSGIRSTAKSVNLAPARAAKALDAVRRYGMKEAARRFLRGDTALLQNMVESWLVYQFGLKPLAYDVFDATVWLQAEQQKQGNLRLTVSLKGGATEEGIVQIPAQRRGTNDATYDIDCRLQRTTGVHYAGVYQIPTTATIPQQLGLYNPAVVAWELLRFSWLVDYVVDIGGWFRSMMAAKDTSFIEGTRSVLKKARLVEFVEVDAGTFPPPLPGGPISGLPRSNVALEADSFQRDVLSHGVMPALLPGIHNRMGLNQLANSLAALTTLVGARQSGGPWHLRQ